jgi:hypothetical protein
MNSKVLNLDLKTGAPAVAIPKEFHMAVGEILNYLSAGGKAQLRKRSEFQWTIWVEDSLPKGTPGLFKVGVLVGIKRTQTESGFSPWELMTIAEMVSQNPTALRAQAEANDELAALDYYWDYVRAIEVEE